MAELKKSEDTYNIASELLNERIRKYRDGLKKFNLNEIVKIKSATASDRPVADHIMTVIFNAFDFLHKEFQLESDEEFAIIMRFLESFHTYSREELLSKEGTHKDALTMELDSDA